MYGFRPSAPPLITVYHHACLFAGSRKSDYGFSNMRGQVIPNRSEKRDCVRRWVAARQRRRVNRLKRNEMSQTDTRLLLCYSVENFVRLQLLRRQTVVK